MQRRAKEVGIRDAGDLHGILKGEKQPGACPFIGFHLQQVDSIHGHAAGGDFIIRMAADHFAQRALARAVRPHDRGDLALLDLEIQATQDFFATDGGVQVFDDQ